MGSHKILRVFSGILLFLKCSASPFYDFNAFDISTGEEVSMKKFIGKVLLIVNVASECGFTDDHYRELVDLQKTYDHSEFNVLAFPCNQFGKQEPKKNKYIIKFAEQNYHVNFPMFSKVKTVGEHAHPIYKWLKQETMGTEPSWNFCKYLLNQHGNVVRYASPSTSPLTFQNDIKKLLAFEELKGGQLFYELEYDEENVDQHNEL